MYIILGVLFGALGFHNFYSGHYLTGGVKLGLVVFSSALDALTGFQTGFSIIFLVIFVVWSLIEVIFVKSDARGAVMT